MIVNQPALMINLADPCGIINYFKEIFKSAFTLPTLDYDDLLIAFDFFYC